MDNTKPLVLALLLAACPLRFRSAALTCAPPAPLVTKLRTEYTNLNRLTWKEENRVEHFSMVKAGPVVLIRHNNDYPGDHPVNVYAGAEEIGGINCGDKESWFDCALQYQEQYFRVKMAPVKASGPPCDFDLPLPLWTPSPNNAQKQRVAREVFQQFTIGRTDDLKSVYVRDFNINDTGLDIYFQYKNGEVFVQGCGLDVKQNPPCVGHLYGQGNLQPLIKHIMQRPYRLYPPPIGKP